MDNKLVYRVETDDGEGMYCARIGICYSEKIKGAIDPATHRPQPRTHIREHLMDVPDKSQYLFGFANIQQVKNWILNPTDFQFLSENFKLSVYEVEPHTIVEDENQLVFFYPKAILVERQSLLNLI